MAELAGNLKVGNGLESDTMVGPLIDERGYQKVEEHVRDAVSRGAEVLAGGRMAPTAWTATSSSRPSSATYRPTCR